MITRKTVFVLGAGASSPYGFPLGAELRQHVLDRFNSTTGQAVHLHNATKFTLTQRNTFIEVLRYSGLQSVDALLERRPEFMDVGKAMMAIDLALAEAASNLWQIDDNWMVYLYSSMIGGSLGEFAENQTAFVTFNYDRSLEHFLFTSLKNTFGKPDEETKAILDKIPIIHLHGRLGYLPWQGSSDVVPYGTSGISKAHMDVFLNEIKVVHEEITDGRDKDFSQAKELLAGAERGYLLGFGFGARNVGRLGMKNGGVRPVNFHGSAFGMTDKEAGACKDLTGGHLKLYPHYACLEFLRNVATLG